MEQKTKKKKTVVGIVLTALLLIVLVAAGGVLAVLYNAGKQSAGEGAGFADVIVGGAEQIAAADEEEKNGLFEFEIDPSTGEATLTKYIGIITTDVEIPTEYEGAPITKIGQHAFLNSIAVNVSIPDSVRIIELGAFQNSAALESVDFPDEMEEICASAFEGCSSLKKVVFPKGIEVTSMGTFKNCSSLIEAILPEGVQQIGGEMFQGCTSLEHFDFPTTTWRIGPNAFASSGIVKLSFPEYSGSEVIRFADKNCFADCQNLIEIVADHEDLAFLGGCFKGCTALEKVELPYVSTYEASLFEGCTALKEFTVGNKCEIIHDRCFYGCTALEKIDLKRAYRIESHAFENCTSLNEVIATNINYAGDRAFAGCTSLEKAPSIRNKGNDVFAGSACE